MFKKFPSDRINALRKMPSFFIREVKRITLLLLICDFYMAWSSRFISRKLCGIFHFQFCSVFVKVYIFVKQNTWTLRL